jgi:hypothetical protein
MRKRVVGPDVAAARLERDDHLDLEVDVLRARRIGELAIGPQIVRVLLEEERRLLVRIVPHLAGVLGIVATDAVDAVDGEKLGGAADRQGSLARRVDDVFHGRDPGWLARIGGRDQDPIRRRRSSMPAQAPTSLAADQAFCPISRLPSPGFPGRVVR